MVTADAPNGMMALCRVTDHVSAERAGALAADWTKSVGAAEALPAMTVTNQPAMNNGITAQAIRFTIRLPFISSLYALVRTDGKRTSYVDPNG